VTCWGSVGFFGPLTVAPSVWTVADAYVIDDWR
jgi:hypothetical protein